MNILQICLRVPFPPKDGAAIAMNSIASGLTECETNLTVLAVNTPKHWVDINKIPNKYLTNLTFKSININTEIKPFQALFSFITPHHSYNISRFYNSEFNLLLQKTLSDNNFDYILIESLFMTPYLSTIRKLSNAKIILRSHNIEYTIWETLAKNEKNSIKKFYLNHLAKRLKKYELKIGKEFDAIVPISLNDERFYKNTYPSLNIKTIYCGVSNDLLNIEIDTKFNSSIYHLGSMDWLPNIEGINWFLKDIWPLINNKNSAIKCYLAGRKMPNNILKQKNESLIVESYIDDSLAFQLKHNIMIVPLVTGGGVRIKILEGLALGKVIVTTSKGAEGLNVENGKNIIIADKPEEFAKMVLKCVADAEFCKYISTNAKSFAKNEFSNKVLAQNLLAFLKTLK
jgi:glycosyltransferase involved in cell wall biosynthesis